MSARTVRNVNKVNSEQGSITLFTLIALTFMLIIAFTAYVSTMSKLNGQNAELEQIKSAYEQDINAESLEKLYNELTGTRGWLPGEGTQQNPYKIYTIEDLVEFANRTNKNSEAESFEGKYVELMNTLDFNNVTTYENAERTDFGDVNGDGQVEGLKTELTTYEGFKPIGSKTAFMGTFKGNNNEIKNLYEDKKTLNVLGLFAKINNATLQDFGVTGSITNTLSANSSATRLGGIVGRGVGNIIIKNVYNKANILCDFNVGNIGGIVGRFEGEGYIENCYNSGNINGSQTAAGIIGSAPGTVTIKNCYNLGEIRNEKTVQGGCHSGGIVASTGTSKCEIIDCYNNGIVIGTNYTGGICGSTSSGETKINHCYNKNKVINITASQIGGIVGATNTNAIITNSYNEGEIIAQSTNSSDSKRIGGIAGLSEGEILNCFNKGIVRSLYACNNIGGISGLHYLSSGVMENCYNAGKIIVEDGNVTMIGGLAGRNYGGATIKNCYSVGTVQYKTVSYFGGVTGYHYSPGLLLNSYYLSTVANKAYNPASSTGVTNCTSKTEAEMKDDSFVTLLDTDNEESVWRADSNNINNGYPILKWQLQQ